MIVIATKRCRRCKRALPTEQFHAAAKNADRLQSLCKDCNCENVKAHKYGIDHASVGFFVSVPCCQACGKAFKLFGDERIDHCHDKSHVRGVVCNACNLAMAGSAEEALHRLRSCIAYLERDCEWQSLEASCPG
jgi:hypothetical protein